MAFNVTIKYNFPAPVMVPYSELRNGEAFKWAHPSMPKIDDEYTTGIKLSDTKWFSLFEFGVVETHESHKKVFKMNIDAINLSPVYKK